MIKLIVYYSLEIYANIQSLRFSVTMLFQNKDY